MPRPLTTQEAHEFLDSKPGWIVLTTLGPDGFPHTVPLGLFPARRRNPHGRAGPHAQTAQHRPQPKRQRAAGIRKHDGRHQGADGSRHRDRSHRTRPDLALLPGSGQASRCSRGRPAHRASPRRRLHQGNSGAHPFVGLLGGPASRCPAVDHAGRSHHDRVSAECSG